METTMKTNPQQVIRYSIDCVSHQIYEDALEPFNYLRENPGKNVRGSIIDAFNNWIQCDSKSLEVIKSLVDDLHTASLIVDDIEDESEMRRGRLAAHKVFGVPQALNCGNYVYFLALEKVLKLKSSTCVEIFTEEMLNLHRGQGQDIIWRSKFEIPTESEYRQMVCDKTGGLFRLAIRLMLEKSILHSQDDKMSQSLDDLVNDLATFFQVRDDLINLASKDFHTKKGFCEDITEGKLSFIVLHSLRTFQENPGYEKDFLELKRILQSATTDRNLIKLALRLLDKTQSFEHTFNFLENLRRTILAKSQLFESNPAFDRLLFVICKDLNDCKQVREVMY